MTAENKSLQELFDRITPSMTPIEKADVDNMNDLVKTLKTYLEAFGANVASFPASATVTHAASATTDGIDVTVQYKDANGDNYAGVVIGEMYISEDADGKGLTADSASGALTAGTGNILTAHTAKKHVTFNTDENGVAVFTLVDSANPTDQYFVVKDPITDKPIVSAASGTNWEGA